MATMPAWEVPVLPSPRPDFEPAYQPRHRKPMSPIHVRLNDDWYAMWERHAISRPHVPRHRADEQVAS